MAVLQRLGRYGEFARFIAKYGSSGRVVADAGEGAHLDQADSATRATEFTNDIEALGPTFVKLGQLLSTRSDLLSPAYLTALARLQDHVAPFPFADVVSTIEEHLGVRVSRAFAALDETPLAAASLGQVHRAVLRSGREVAVKVQRPDVRPLVLEDLDTLDQVGALLERFTNVTQSFDVPRVLEEFRRTILLELDYECEARNLTELATQLAGIPEIVVPLPVADYTSTQVLTMDYVAGTKVTAINPVVFTDLDGSSLADALFNAYLRQILVDGSFHADPHPGNVLLTPDHRLALIDLGMVGHVSGELQEQLFRLLLALVDGRGDETARLVIGLGKRLDHFDEGRIRHTIDHLVERYQHTPTSELNVGRTLIEMARGSHRSGLRLPAELPLLGKTLLNLHDLGRVLDPRFDVNGAMRRHASSLMRRRMLKSLTPSHLLSSAMELRDLAARLPERVNRVLDAVAANDVRLKVELIDHGSIIDGLQKVANRIALGVVLAALIIGAAMLMRIDSTLTIFGYPALAMALFLAAVGGGLWMVWTIVSSDVRRKVVK
jgi:ubiquinone biosynthesis protein